MPNNNECIIREAVANLGGEAQFNSAMESLINHALESADKAQPEIPALKELGSHFTVLEIPIEVLDFASQLEPKFEKLLHGDRLFVVHDEACSPNESARLRAVFAYHCCESLNAADFDVVGPEPSPP